MSDSLIRVVHNKENPYVMLNKQALWDKDLSLSAVGLWTRLLSRPTDWKIYILELAESCNCDKSVIYRCMKELIAAGYALTYRKRKKVGNRTVFDSVNYVIFEFKADEQFKKSFLQTVFQEVEIPEVEKPPLLNKDSTNPSSLRSEVKEEIYDMAPKSPATSDPVSPESESIYTFFLASLKKRNPKFKEPNKNKWLKEIDKLLRVDKRDVSEVIEIIKWSETARYHKTSCLSPEKLRKQYDEMLMKREESREIEIESENRKYLTWVLAEYPQETKGVAFNKLYVINTKTGIEIPFSLPFNSFKEALDNVVRSSCMKR